MFNRDRFEKKKIKIMNCAVHNVALRCLIAPGVWWFLSVCALPPLHGVWSLTPGSRTEISAGDLGLRSLPGAAHPPSSCAISMSPTDCPCGCTIPVLGLTKSCPLLCPRPHPAFQPPLGQLQVAPCWVFKVSTCWISTWNNPTTERGKQPANAVAPVWISASSRVG